MDRPSIALREAYRKHHQVDLQDDSRIVQIHTDRIRSLEGLETCQELQHLEIVANLVEKIDFIEALEELTYLELYQNSLRRIENLPTNLQCLDVSFNGIRKIENLVELREKLTKLYVSSNKIESLIGIEELAELKLLECGNNRIRELIPEHFQRLEKLEELWAGKNKIMSMKVPMLLNLKILDLRSNRITQWDESILALEELQTLSLSHNQLNKIPENFFKMNSLPKLKELDLAGNKLTSASSIRNLKGLTCLYLDYNQLGPSALDELEHLALLESINVSHNPPMRDAFGPSIRTKCIEALKNAKGLQELNGDLLDLKSPQIPADSLR